MGNTHQAQKSRLEADASKGSWNAQGDYEWGYSKECGTGPDTWWIHYPSGSGNYQSPINISSEEADLNEQLTASIPLKVEYPTDEGNKMIWNTGHLLQVEVRSRAKSFYVTGGPLKNQQFELRQFHFHWGERDEFGSEHTVDNRSYAMEIHFVHWSPEFDSFEEAARCEGGLVILCVFAKLENRSNTSIEHAAAYVNKIVFKRQFENLPSSYDIRALLPKDLKRYWTYKGSITTPPCYESVTWIVFQDTINVSSYELSSLRLLHNHEPNGRPPDDEHGGYILKNLRPVQPLGNRKISSVAHNIAIGGQEYFEQYPSQTAVYGSDAAVFTSKDDFTWDRVTEDDNY